jgi:Cu+-exporting ATPase
MDTDPVCGMTVESGKQAGSSTYQGKTYHFCSVVCKEQFERNPQPFVQKAAQGKRTDRGS